MVLVALGQQEESLTVGKAAAAKDSQGHILLNMRNLSILEVSKIINLISNLSNL